MRPYRFVRDAEAEMLEAADHLDRQAPRLGRSYLRKVSAAIEDVRRNPRRWRILKLDVRRRLVDGFPYGVLYREDGDDIVILAVMHTSRKPDYWIGRI